MARRAGWGAVRLVRSLDGVLAELTMILHVPLVSLPDPSRATLRRLHDRERLFRGRKVLVVNRDMRTVFTLSRLFEESGASVSLGRTIEDGLARLESEPDIVLTVIDMESVARDRVDLKDLRGAGVFGRLPLVALIDGRSDPERWAESGADDWISKPVCANHLFHAVRSCLFH